MMIVVPHLWYNLSHGDYDDNGATPLPVWSWYYLSHGDYEEDDNGYDEGDLTMTRRFLSMQGKVSTRAFPGIFEVLSYGTWIIIFNNNPHNLHHNLFHSGENHLDACPSAAVKLPIVEGAPYTIPAHLVIRWGGHLGVSKTPSQKWDGGDGWDWDG